MAIIPLDPDEMTDTENFEEDNLDEEEVQNVAGTVELLELVVVMRSRNWKAMMKHWLQRT